MDPDPIFIRSTHGRLAGQNNEHRMTGVAFANYLLPFFEAGTP